MAKMMFRTYVYLMYIVGLPIFMIFSIVMLTYHCISNKRSYGEFDVKDSIMAWYEGCKFGHQTNMYRVEHFDE